MPFRFAKERPTLPGGYQFGDMRPYVPSYTGALVLLAATKHMGEHAHVFDVYDRYHDVYRCRCGATVADVETNRRLRRRAT